MVITEIPEHEVQEMLKDPNSMSRCDLIIFMFENENESINYVKDICPEVSPMIPRILVQSKMDQVKDSSEMIQSTMALANELEIQRYFEISSKEVNQNNFKALTEQMLEIMITPNKGMSDRVIQMAKEQ